MSKIDDIKKIMPPEFTVEVDDLGEEDTMTILRMKMLLYSLTEMLEDVIEATASTTLIQATMVITAAEHLKEVLGVSNEMLASIKQSAEDIKKIQSHPFMSTAKVDMDA